VPATVSSVCERVFEAYAVGGGGELGLGDGAGSGIGGEALEVLRSSDAAEFGEALALEALALLAEQRGEVLDLHFAPLYSGEFLETPSGVVHGLLAFLRARLLGQDPVLRLPADTAPIGLTLVLIAGQAVVEAGDDRRELVRTALSRLRHSPVELRVPAGDLGYALDDADGGHSSEQVARDQVRRMLTGTVPLSAAGTDDKRLWLAVDAAARPDVRDLMRILAVDPPPGGADTRTEWSLYINGPSVLVRLSIDCLEPVLVRFALAFDLDKHGEVLREAARTAHFFLLLHVPRFEGARQEHVAALLVPHDGSSLARLLAHAAAQRGGH
jgi:hypothetical protein